MGVGSATEGLGDLGSGSGSDVGEGTGTGAGLGGGGGVGGGADDGSSGATTGEVVGISGMLLQAMNSTATSSTTVRQRNHFLGMLLPLIREFLSQPLTVTTHSISTWSVATARLR